ncbi:hypothetical protein, partial [Methylobacterium sp. E-046]|uniref:hypothetical protein n=1 Tax=Methylobacterium sp. E-046 TaxID=2836576 RepID=UPI001FB87972
TDAKTLYDSGVGSQIYQGPRVADFSTDQSAGIQSTRDQAAADNAGGLRTAHLQSVLGANGLSPTTQHGLGMLAAVPEASTARLSGLADRIGDPVRSEHTLQVRRAEAASIIGRGLVTGGLDAGR